MALKISVLVLAWNGEKYLDACLRALLDQDVDGFQVIVIDNGSSDASVSIAERFAPRVGILRNDRNLGFAGGNNVGIRSADGDVVVLLNQDTAVQAGWLRALGETYDDAAVGIVGCKALYMDGRHIQHAGGVIQGEGAFAYHIGRGEVDGNQYNQLVDAQYVTGAALGIHRRVIEKIGLLDARFFPAFYEEVDYCYRARRAGFRIVYQPRAILHHHETASIPEHDPARAEAYHSNRVRFVLRHWNAAELDAFVNFEGEAIGTSSLFADVAARARAYRDNVVGLARVLYERKRDPTLGGPLGPAESRRILDRLLALRRQAAERTVSLKVDLIRDRQRSAFRDKASRRASMIGAQDKVPVTVSTADLDLSKWLPENYLITMPHPASRVPFLGPLIFRFREAVYSLFLRHYLSPVLRQQSVFNEQLVQSLGLLHQAIVSDRADDHSRMELLGQAAIEELGALQRMTIGDEMALLAEIGELNARLLGVELSQDTGTAACPVIPNSLEGYND